MHRWQPHSNNSSKKSPIFFPGKSITQVGPFQTGVLYEDVNDDSIIDEVHTTISNTQNLDTKTREWAAQKALCDGVVTSGVPVSRAKLYNHSICMEGGLLHSFEFLRSILRNDEEEGGNAVNHLGAYEIPGFGGRDHFDEMLSAATPISIHRYVMVFSKCNQIFIKNKNRHIHQIDKITMFRTDILFFISSGLVTCINGKTGKLRWHADTDASFGQHANQGAMFMKMMRGKHEGFQETALDAKHRYIAYPPSLSP